jgi:uncharacterized membrane protein YheB (UPF0754 family)
MEEIGKRIEKTIRGKLMSAFPMLSMFLSDEMIEKVTNLFKGELEEFLQSSAQGFSSNKIEELLIGFMEQEFRFIEKVGAVLGFFIGCIQVLIVIGL